MRKMQWSISEKVNATAFKPLPLCSAAALESHFLSKNVFWENAVGYLRNSECYSFQTFAIVFCTPENLLVGISWALGTKESHFLG